MFAIESRLYCQFESTLAECLEEEEDVVLTLTAVSPLHRLLVAEGVEEEEEEEESVEEAKGRSVAEEGDSTPALKCSGMVGES